MAIKQLCEIVLFGADWVSVLESAGETVVAMQTEAHREIADTQQRLDNLFETIELGKRGDRVRNRIAELERALAAKKIAD